MTGLKLGDFVDCLDQLRPMLSRAWVHFTLVERRFMQLTSRFCDIDGAFCVSQMHHLLEHTADDLRQALKAVASWRQDFIRAGSRPTSRTFPSIAERLVPTGFSDLMASTRMSTLLTSGYDAAITHLEHSMSDLIAEHLQAVMSHCAHLELLYDDDELEAGNGELNMTLLLMNTKKMRDRMKRFRAEHEALQAHCSQALINDYAKTLGDHR